ncbi:Asp-tRNA(Asn)/Glu-tRNA(Gln) amidotransferase GatCAB subunit A [Candidatus Peregrinibacteria bacterium CG11_big_fil_rev_8_21_14_0_20_41_10]|nr:MAG: Asp-tRNA(Asn)/Glu-tRNA(Gln) amidotransferase GatCAB subunit A [Candidatus Peregrinibacteria bacterium CG11_big_fil_rev_8_21_14_0_20_41_10]PIZ75748.1 MAG: Asp-tRNA(Asn)/Glu-tRNA(Gln) amidotransferase GatCAB subunit A [Candidatus Peregrinibacteria bacterium CG_4_10_14_0_2_um_filter_41_8]PJC37859.1 MAG: Asp-tRNA(Asn)/Glu-tRNA(Gln) amidotransferase GatCAB subunit A [Candidatus Peregrinibacteria bacterium CG_4_9_14_0_2_um_filter_41_14]
MELNTLSVKELLEGYQAKTFSPLEVVDAYADAIKQENPALNAYILETVDVAKSQIDESAQGSLANVPMALKDVFSTEGIETTACSNILKGFKPPYNAPVVDRLYDQGAILLGKVNTDEFTCGASSETSAFGVTKNPANLECVAGGSSGGSAAAVAANLCAFSMGTDTGGSIRQPASFCGSVGLKVTYGRVPRSGVISMASSLDTVGALTKTVYDAALVLGAIAGSHRLDTTAPNVKVDAYLGGINNSIKGMRIGLPKEYFSESVEPDVRARVMEAVEVLKNEGAIIKEVSLPMTKYGVAVYYIISPSEVSSNMARFDGVRYGPRLGEDPQDLYEFYLKNRGKGFGPEMKRRIMMGTYALSAGYYDAYYLKAQKVRTLICQDFEQVFEEVDVLAAPVSPFPAFKIGAKSDDPVAMYNADALTIPSAIAGLPGLSVPCGNTTDGLPVGLQLMSPQWSEAKLLNVGHAYEMAGR